MTHSTGFDVDIALVQRKKIERLTASKDEPNRKASSTERRRRAERDEPDEKRSADKRFLPFQPEHQPKILSATEGRKKKEREQSFCISCCCYRRSDADDNNDDNVEEQRRCDGGSLSTNEKRATIAHHYSCPVLSIYLFVVSIFGINAQLNLSL